MEERTVIKTRRGYSLVQVQKDGETHFEVQGMDATSRLYGSFPSQAEAEAKFNALVRAKEREMERDFGMGM